MELSEIKENMKVRISCDLQKTDEEWTTTSEMRKMAGGIYRVRSVGVKAVNIYSDTGGSWTFSADDILPVLLTPPIAPVMFDPENIGG